MEASGFFDDSDLGEGTGYADPATQQDEQEFVELMAERIAGQAREQLDPLVAHRHAEAMEAEAARATAASHLVAQERKLLRPSARQRLTFLNVQVSPALPIPPLEVEIGA